MELVSGMYPIVRVELFLVRSKKRGAILFPLASFQVGRDGGVVGELPKIQHDTFCHTWCAFRSIVLLLPSSQYWHLEMLEPEPPRPVAGVPVDRRGYIL